GNNSREGKATGGADIFVDVTAGGGVLGITVAGDPGEDTWPLGKPLPVLAGATTEATIEVFDNDVLVSSVTGTELMTDVIFTNSGPHTVKIVATAGEQVVQDSFILNAELVTEFTSPTGEIVTATAGTSINLMGTAYVSADLTISDGTTDVFTATDVAAFDETFVLPAGGVTTYTLTASFGGEMATDVITFVTGAPETAEPPAGLRPGAVDMPNGDLTLQLRAPGKSDVFVIGNFNDWTPNADSRMKRTSDEGTFWITLTGLEEGEDILYQYLIDGTIVQPDPYSTLVLDPFNDPFIEASTFADLPAYPDNASGILSWHRRGVAPYAWQSSTDYGRPDPKKMVVYELLVRDFLADHSYKSLTDTLDYLERLGVNTIELMPVSEFEGNISWGYNVSFHMALDKYYGSPEDFKAFVDACHQRGMGVVLDVVYNHAFGQSALARMWWDETAFRPTADNPYLNVEAKHPFNVGYDFNHESELTQEFVKTTLEYWIEEFRIDGFRFDLSKGFTQNFSADVGAWNRYDADRVAIIKDYADFVWSVDSETYMIMEHLAELREENELGQYGNEMYFWTGGGLHNQYLEASMGYPSNLRGALATNNGFAGLNQMGYMESHDEERMQVKNEKFGNSAGSYDVTDQATGLERVELASTFFYTVPGPKMLWQFGELGYDFAINYCQNGTENEGCRTDPKPIRWDYRAEADRQDVYDWIADLLYLRNNYDFFHGEVVRQELSQAGKLLHLRGADGDAVIVGNFGVTELTINNVFPNTGAWYAYDQNRTLDVQSTGESITLAPGEFEVYLSQRIVRNGDNNIGTSTNDRAVARLQMELLPNPNTGAFQLNFDLATPATVQVDLLDVSGRHLGRLYAGARNSGAQSLSLRTNVRPGLYFLRLTDGLGSAVRRVIVSE
ncbi:MAG: alpha-amylase family glycosyl hydrolase, partial [Bacteroidota bacterium]